VCTNTYKVGQTFTASLANAVSGSNGASIPAGADVTLEVTQLKRSENVNVMIVMEFAVRSVTFGGKTYSISGNVADANVERVRNQPKSKDTQKVVGGAAGAAAGAAAAAATANYEGCVPDGGAITVELTSPVQVRVSA
jgi:hypothetical protein